MSLRTPTYRRHAGSGQAVTTLNGRDFYLGKFGSIESKAEYDRMDTAKALKVMEQVG